MAWQGYNIKLSAWEHTTHCILVNNQKHKKYFKMQRLIASMYDYMEVELIPNTFDQICWITEEVFSLFQIHSIRLVLNKHYYKYSFSNTFSWIKIIIFQFKFDDWCTNWGKDLKIMFLDFWLKYRHDMCTRNSHPQYIVLFPYVWAIPSGSCWCWYWWLVQAAKRSHRPPTTWTWLHLMMYNNQNWF